MTLINYLTRVHFADGVLEEALRSEMEHHAKRRPLIVVEDGDLGGAVAERFFSSFPIRTRAETFSAIPYRANETAARQVAQAYRHLDCDLLIAFGSNRAIDLAKVARIAIAYDEPISALTTEQGGAHRIKKDLPDLYSVPGVLGFASAITDYTRVGLDVGGQAMLSSRHLIPTVTICDPTLTMGARAVDTATAAAGIFARGVDAFLAPGYNPPADALALDALGRVMPAVMQVLADDTIPARREMMAAGLNSSLAMQKGLCAVHALSNAVAAVAPHRIDPSALGGVLIPELSRRYEEINLPRLNQIKRAVRMPKAGSLGDHLSEFLADLPLATTLSELDVSPNLLPEAARLASEDRAIVNGPLHLGPEENLDILRTVQGDHRMAVAQ
jgi:alcohol dehydrogenase class IV